AEDGIRDRNVTGVQTCALPISWKVDVPEDGLYKIGIKNKQNTLRGVFSTRKITINNEVPFQELEKTSFNYDNNWKMDVLGDDERSEERRVGKECRSERSEERET